MGQKSKKLFAILLTMAMVFSLLPVTAFAQNNNLTGPDEDFGAVEAGTVSTERAIEYSSDDGIESGEGVTFQTTGGAFKFDLDNASVTASGITLNSIDLSGRTSDFTIEPETTTDGAFTVTVESVRIFVDINESPGSYDPIIAANHVNDAGNTTDLVEGFEIEVTATSQYSSAASRIIDVDPDDPSVNKGSEIEVQFRTGARTPLNGGTPEFYVQSSRDAETLYYTNKSYDDFDDVKADVGNGVTRVSASDLEDAKKIDDVSTTSNGKVYLWVTTGVPGDVEIKVGKGEDDDNNVTRQISGSPAKIAFEETDADEIWMLNDDGDRITDYAGDYDYTAEAGKNFDVAALIKAGNTAAEDVEVEFFESEYKDRRFSSIGTEDSDSDGVAEIEVNRRNTKTYWYSAEAGDVDYDDVTPVAVKVVAGSPHNIEADKDTEYVEVDKEEKINFIIKDRYGNEYDKDALEHHKDGDVDEVFRAEVTDPDGDKLDDDDFTVDIDDDEFYVEVDFDEEGTWTVEGFIKGTGISAVTEVVVAEFGDVADLEIELDPEVLRTEATAEAVEVTLIDELGIKRVLGYDEFEDDDVSLSSDNPSVARVSKEGLVRAGDDAGIATITAYHEPTGLEDSAELHVSGEPTSLEVEWDVEKEALEGEVTLTYLDKDGYKSALTPEEAEDDDDYRIIVPTGVDYFDKEKFEEGKASTTFGLEAEEYGTYTIRVVTDLGVSKTFSVDFYEDVVDKGAEHVLMTIGSTAYEIDGIEDEMDVAPFIEEDRTFVPVRFLAQAFNAEADWGPKDSLTEWVTLTRADLEITIYIGEEEFEVYCVETDETETHEADAPARIVNGRTFLPFRAIGEAFGADVDYSSDPDTGLTYQVWFTQR